jgi:hypothetical protein
MIKIKVYRKINDLHVYGHLKNGHNMCLQILEVRFIEDFGVKLLELKCKYWRNNVRKTGYTCIGR